MSASRWPRRRCICSASSMSIFRPRASSFGLSLSGEIVFRKPENSRITIESSTGGAAGGGGGGAGAITSCPLVGGILLNDHGNYGSCQFADAAGPLRAEETRGSHDQYAGSHPCCGRPHHGEGLARGY